MTGLVMHASAERFLDAVLPPLGWQPSAEDRLRELVRRLQLAFDRAGTPYHRDGLLLYVPEQRGGAERGDGPEIFHSEYRYSGDHGGYAYWDLPGTPGYVSVACTPCPQADLGQGDDVAGFRDYRGYLCRLKHAHHGAMPERDARWFGRREAPDA